MNLEKNMYKNNFIYTPIPQNDPPQDIEDPPPDDPQTFSVKVRPRFGVGRSRNGSLQYGTDRTNRPRPIRRQKIIYYPGNIFLNIMNYDLRVYYKKIFSYN